jgi:hypothetical protein
VRATKPPHHRRLLPPSIDRRICESAGSASNRQRTRQSPNVDHRDRLPNRASPGLQDPHGLPRLP